jgi:hypothetical protein
MPDIWLIVVTVALGLILGTLAWWGAYAQVRNFRKLRGKVVIDDDEPIRPSYTPGAQYVRLSSLLRLRRTTPHLSMQIVVSLALLGVGLYVILIKQYPPADNNWAYGAVGTVIGYWLKGK